MLAFESARKAWVLRVRRRLAGLGAHLSLVGSRRAHLVVIVAVLVMASAGALASRAGAQSEPRASEVTVLPGSYGGGGGWEHEVPRRPDVHMFGFVRDGSMMVPVRPVAEAYGATVHWVAGVGTLVNGHLVETATVLSQAYSPARELAAILGCWLEWDQVARTVILSNGIQRVIVSVPAGSWVEKGVATREATGVVGVSAGPGAGGPRAADAAHAAAAGGAAGTMSAGTTAAAVPGSAAGATATATTTVATAASAGAGALIGAGERPGMTGGAGGGAVTTTGSGPAAGVGTGSASAAGTGSGGSGLSTPGGTGVSGTVPGVIIVTPVTPAAPGIGTGGAGTQAAAGLPGDAPQPGAPVVTIASLPSEGSPGALGSTGGPGGGTPVVVITPLPGPGAGPGPGPTAPPGEGPDGGGAAGAARRGPGGRPSAGKIALTFDDGPDAVYTKKILSVLDRYRVKATFFLIGNQVERHSAVVREMASAGHELGNHGYSHSRLTTLSAEAVRREISRTQEAVKAAANVTPKWFRPPYGSYDDEIRRIAKEEGATTVLWTLNPDDWRNPGQAAIVERVTSGARDGAIVLLHVREQTAHALPVLIEGLTSLGYEIVPLSALFAGYGGRPALRTGGGQDEAAGAGPSPEPAGQQQGTPAGPVSGTGAGAADAVAGATGAD